MTDHGPALGVRFSARQIVFVTDWKGNIVEGSKNKKEVIYSWTLCRDQTEIDPKSAWRLMKSEVHPASKIVKIGQFFEYKIQD